MQDLEKTFAEAAAVLQLTEVEQRQLLAHQRGIEVVRIARSLLSCFPPERAAAWLRAPNRGLGGRPAIDLLLSPDLDEILQLRRFVEYWSNNGW